MALLKKNKAANGNGNGNGNGHYAVLQKFLEGIDIVEFYKVSRHAYALVYRDKGRVFYMPIEPILVNGEAERLAELRDLLPRVFHPDPNLIRRAPWLAEARLEKALRQILDMLKINLEESSYEKILYYLKRDFLGYGPIDVMYNDPKIEDITVAGAGSPVYVFHREHEWLPTTVVFEDEEELTNFARRLAYRAGQDLVYANPIVEGPLPPRNFRAHITLDVVSRRGTSFTIRRSSEEPFTLPKLVSLGTLNPSMAAYLWLLVSHTMTMLIAGPMASGKTTLLNAIAMLIPPQKKIVTIEETSELRLEHENWTPLIARPSSEEGVRNIDLFELLKSSLRQRPDYIIVGEIRGEEAYTFFQAISVGHGGMGTIHGESYDQVIRRLENPPLNVPRSMIPLLNTMVILSRVKEEGAIVRKVVEVVDITGYDPIRDMINSVPSYKYVPSSRDWAETQIPPGLRLVSNKTGLSEKELLDDLRKRRAIIKWMVGERMFHHTDVARVMQEYYYSPDAIYDKARAAGYR